MADRKQPEAEPCPVCGEKEVLQHLGGAPIIHSGEGITQSGKPHPEFKQLMDNIQKKNHLNVDRYRR